MEDPQQQPDAIWAERAESVSDQTERRSRRLLVSVRMDGRARAATGGSGRPSSEGTDRQVLLVQFLPQHLRYGRGDVRQLDRIKGVAVAFVEFGLVAVQSENLVTVGRLEDTEQWLRVKAVGHDEQFRDGALQLEIPELAVGRTKNGQPVR